jgi:hypothetical protein
MEEGTMSVGSKLALALVAGAAALALAPQAAEAGTVVASSGPSAGTYPVGAQIGDTQRITLQQGDSITVLDGGSTRVLRGPGTFILATRSASAGNTALAALTSRRAGSRARTGAVRGVEGANPTTNPNLWYVDVEASGTVCLSNVDRVNLWRAPSEEEAVYMIAPADDPDNGVTATFAGGEILARWDSALQLRDGATYTIGREGDETPSEVTITILTDVPEDDPEAIAQALISNGCALQLGQIIAAAQAEES